MINRRQLLVGSAASGGLIGAGITVPSTAHATLAKPVDTNLDILLTNFRQRLQNGHDLADSTNFFVDFTTQVWNQLLIRNFIPIRAEPGLESFTPQMLKTHSELDLVFDGCLGCQNCRKWQHDAIKCQTEIDRINMDHERKTITQMASEIDQRVLQMMIHHARALAYPIHTTSNDLFHVATSYARSNPATKWMIMSSDIIERHFVSDDSLIIYWNGIRIYNDKAMPPKSVLIGHDTADHPVMTWHPQLLVVPRVTVNAGTLMPVLRFHYEAGYTMRVSRPQDGGGDPWYTDAFTYINGS